MDEIVQIRLRLLGGKEVAFESKAAAAGVSSIGDAAQESAAKTRAASAMSTGALNRIGAAGRRMQAVGRSMTYGITLPVIGIGLMAIKTAADFERSMAQVRVATGLPSSQMAEMRDLAMEMGRETIFSANDAAQAMLELAKGGLSAAQIRAGGLQATMNLAAAGGIELADAATQIVGSMGAFNLKAGEAAQVSNALAGAAIASTADLGDLSQAFQQASAQASAAGWSVQETAAALAILADAGIRGSDAGTSLRTFLQRLNPQTDKARSLMKQLGLQFYDSEGRLKGLAGVTGELRRGLKGMTDEQRGAALQTLFGSDAIRAANIIYGASAGKIREYIKATSDKTAAEKMAEAQMEGLPGALEKMKGSLETAALAAGTAAAPAISTLAGVIGTLTDGLTQLPGPAQTAIIVIASLAAIAGPTIWALGSIAGGVVNLIKAYRWFSDRRGAAAAGNWISGFSGRMRGGGRRVRGLLRSLISLPKQMVSTVASTAAGEFVTSYVSRIRARAERFRGVGRTAGGWVGRGLVIGMITYGLVNTIPKFKAWAQSKIPEWRASGWDIGKIIGDAISWGIKENLKIDVDSIEIPGTGGMSLGDALAEGAKGVPGISEAAKALGGQSGGPVTRMGARGPRDTVLRWLDPREYVIRREAVARLGIGALDRVNRGQMPVVRPLVAGGASVSGIEAIDAAGLGGGDIYIHSVTELDGRVVAENTAKHSQDAEARA